MNSPAPDEIDDTLARAVAAIREADGLLVTAGAGMGVDSGLPDFRGNEGLWAAYPALGRARLDFTRIANPAAFLANPRLAWGFYGHRLKRYRDTRPHEGFALLQRIAEPLAHGLFVFTSNVDGQFQKAGFPESRILECHGSIHHLQCLSSACSSHIWPAAGFAPAIDEAGCLLTNAFPRCPACSGIARPNILMFDDWNWLENRTRQQHLRIDDWLARVRRPVVVELGAGTAIPTVRHFGERVGGSFIRINPRDAQRPRQDALVLELGALDGIRRLAERLL
ncbi:SIR2 family NAD-dependent protein deacylase [Zoogloea dura]|jgi:NAD-dependent SIR2 family protein deacetylase|uniref:protein acetyllysine N-acetyltransferase n=1 Tax=Zoogloea dura TaxID=2728840 RepID=A0A848GB03_9RHOO|nr:Sir2 family NAD-dependent protein deacetylase [Zoogloea dura]NML28570.1 NAD-dependent deacetylase [Zoogloea dura]